MAIDWNKVDEVTLALLNLTAFKEQGIVRSWKSHDWNVMNRLHEKGWIQNPVGKAQSVVLTDEGIRQSEALFAKSARLVVAAGKLGLSVEVSVYHSSSVRPTLPNGRDDASGY